LFKHLDGLRNKADSGGLVPSSGSINGATVSYGSGKSSSCSGLCLQ